MVADPDDNIRLEDIEINEQDLLELEMNLEFMDRIDEEDEE